MNLNVFIMQCIKPTSFIFPENTNDLGLLLLRSRILVVCAAVRTLLFITSLWDSGVCSSVDDKGEAQLLGRLLVIKWVYVRESFTSLSVWSFAPTVHLHCSPKPSTCGDVPRLWGKEYAVLWGHLLLSRVLLSCVYATASVTTAVFPMLRLTACRRAKFTVV